MGCDFSYMNKLKKINIFCNKLKINKHINHSPFDEMIGITDLRLFKKGIYGR